MPQAGEHAQASSKSNRRLSVVYFSKSTSIGPTSRYRILQFLPGLADHGIDCRVYPLFGPTYWRILEIPFSAMQTAVKAVYVLGRFAQRLWDVVTMGAVDLVVIEGQLFPYLPPWIEWMVVKSGRRVVVEFDDAIYLTAGHRRKVPALMRMASGVIVGNDTLSRYAANYAPRVCVVPTVVDTDRFVPLRRREEVQSNPNRPLTVVWMGLAYNLPYLNQVAPVLRELQEQGRITFRIVCSRPLRWPGLAVDFRMWSLEQEVDLLQDCDIGIMPLQDNEWARGKCGLKLLQYMAVGLPAIASPVGVNQDIVRDGANGFLASSEAEWRAKLIQLCSNAKLRIEIGKAARQTVIDHYSLMAWTPKLAASYWDLANNGKTAASQSAIPRPVRP
ncbi:MAG TPA: glycosyltransferase family 4 protein [Nitrospira sp.]|nr:glycosyltransferase family 4 protein [Nitrospira sp.]